MNAPTLPSLQLDGDRVYVDAGWKLADAYAITFTRGGRVKRQVGAETLIPYSVGDSLWYLAAESNCTYANQLGKAELLAVWWCCLNAPFPLGGGAEIYRRALAQIEAETLEVADASLQGREPRDLEYLSKPAVRGLLYDHSLGALRWHLVDRAGSGCNAPTDSYLRMAVAVRDQSGLHPELADERALAY